MKIIKHLIYLFFSPTSNFFHNSTIVVKGEYWIRQPEPTQSKEDA